ALMGDAIYANPLLLGFAWQQGWIPLARQAIERAIELNAVAVGNNLAAFEWGRRLADAPQRVRRLAGLDGAPAGAGVSAAAAAAARGGRRRPAAAAQRRGGRAAAGAARRARRGRRAGRARVRRGAGVPPAGRPSPYALAARALAPCAPLPAPRRPTGSPRLSS